MKVKIGHRAIRAFFNGVGIGILSGTSIYILTSALNKLAEATVLDPIAMTLFVIGGFILSSFGIEWSKDIEEQEK
ncbi:MAG: hypothetical protein QMD13_09365 [Candidatus Bathyarchaeia archaeon]|nr:hypothetical protein [Candidatus Bathyarchaeia archaeon]